MFFWFFVCTYKRIPKNWYQKLNIKTVLTIVQWQWMKCFEIFMHKKILTYHCKSSKAFGSLLSNESLFKTNWQASGGHSIARPVRSAYYRIKKVQEVSEIDKSSINNWPQKSNYFYVNRTGTSPQKLAEVCV